ncbi:hypothetical protein LBMAG27_23020 [Bacteroidota bacterium]|nr:hypothetical protein LBMAG27_23020 [Bacteroidota bacterium]
MKKVKLPLTILIVLIVSFEAISSKNSKPFQTAPWLVPASASDIKSPMGGNTTAASTGKLLYVKYCVVCHGNAGKGDGVAAPALAIPPADHSSIKVQSQTDGALYWKITIGRGAMASYKTTLTDQQRWQLVSYIRTLAAVKKTK